MYMLCILPVIFVHILWKRLQLCCYWDLDAALTKNKISVSLRNLQYIQRSLLSKFHFSCKWQDKRLICRPWPQQILWKWLVLRVAPPKPFEYSLLKHTQKKKKVNEITKPRNNAGLNLIISVYSSTLIWLIFFLTFIQGKSSENTSKLLKWNRLKGNTRNGEGKQMDQKLPNGDGEKGGKEKERI